MAEARRAVGAVAVPEGEGGGVEGSWVGVACGRGYLWRRCGRGALWGICGATEGICGAVTGTGE